MRGVASTEEEARDAFEAKYVFFSLDLMTFSPRTFLIREPNLFVYLVFRVSLSENQVL